MVAKIAISRWQWLQLGVELRRRGQGRRESGAFLLARRDGIEVRQAIYYDDLDPHCLDRGFVDLDGAAFVPLWDLCEKQGLRVVADIHTHPSAWTQQSPTDIKNPMVPVRGHFSLIAPNYAKAWFTNLKGMGIFEYEAFQRWKTWRPNSGVVKLHFL